MPHSKSTKMLPTLWSRNKKTLPSMMTALRRSTRMTNRLHLVRNVRWAPQVTNRIRKRSERIISTTNERARVTGWRQTNTRSQLIRLRENRNTQRCKFQRTSSRFHEFSPFRNTAIQTNHPSEEATARQTTRVFSTLLLISLGSSKLWTRANY